MNARTLIAITLFLLAGCDAPRPAAPALPPGALQGRAFSIADGDSFTMDAADGSRIRVRLFGIDAPERGQPYSNKARQALESKTMGRELLVVERDKDPYGRIVANLFVDGRRINVELVEEGWAWHYTRHSSDRDLANAEARAKLARRGLWADADAVPPWDWRKRQRAE